MHGWLDVVLCRVLAILHSRSRWITNQRKMARNEVTERVLVGLSTNIKGMSVGYSTAPGVEGCNCCQALVLAEEQEGITEGTDAKVPQAPSAGGLPETRRSGKSLRRAKRPGYAVY